MPARQPGVPAPSRARRVHGSPAIAKPPPIPEPTFKVAGESSSAERNARAHLLEVFRECPIPGEELLANLALFANRQDVTRMLFLNDLYRRILDVQGVIMELGVRWGRDLALFEALRGMYEPFNYTRRMIGFDTFEGFPSVDAKDGEGTATAVGAYGVTDAYERYLDSVLDHHQQESPISHIKKHEIVKGDATQTVPRYLEDHPETIVALAYFDFDIYEPTRACLEAIRPHLTRGSVVGFDELNCPEFPGETLALREVLGLDRYRIQRSPHGSYPSWIVIE